MILELKVENFRSLKNNTELEFLAENSSKKEYNVATINLPDGKTIRALKILAIYGHNASGKSNIIRACYDVFSFLKDTQVTVDDKIRCYDPFDFDTVSGNMPSKFDITFIGPDKIRYNYFIEFTLTQILNENLVYFPNNKPIKIFNRSYKNSEEGFIHLVELGPKWNSEKIKLFHNQSMIAKCGVDYPHEIITPIFSYFNGIRIINALNPTHGGKLIDKTTLSYLENPILRQKLQQLIKFCDLAVIGFNIEKKEKSDDKKENEHPASNVFALHNIFDEKEQIKGAFPLSIFEESHGTRTIFSLGGAILETLEKGGVIMIDELETSLHPFISKLFVELFQNKITNPKNAQIIFTTHESTLMNRELLRRDQIWFTEKNGKGVTDLFSMKDFDDVREDSPYDKWYLMGKMGAVANLIDLDQIFNEEN